MIQPEKSQTSTADVQQLRSAEQIGVRLVDVLDQIKQLNDECRTLKASLAEQIGVGGDLKVGNVTIAVREPNRRLDLDKAWALLSPDQQALAVERSASKVRSYLPPVLLEDCYLAGTGDPIVQVR